MVFIENVPWVLEDTQGWYCQRGSIPVGIQATKPQDQRGKKKLSVLSIVSPSLRPLLGHKVCCKTLIGICTVSSELQKKETSLELAQNCQTNLDFTLYKGLQRFSLLRPQRLSFYLVYLKLGFTDFYHKVPYLGRGEQSSGICVLSKSIDGTHLA